MKTQSQSAVTLFHIGYKCHFSYQINLRHTENRSDIETINADHVLAAGSALGCIVTLLHVCVATDEYLPMLVTSLRKGVTSSHQQVRI